MSQPPLGNDVFRVDFLPGPERGGHGLGMVPLFSLLALLSGGYFAELAGLSQCDACPHTRSALPALGHEGKFPDGPNISRAQGNMTLRGRLRGNNVCKFTGEVLTFVTQAYNIFFKGKISWPAWLLQSLEIVNAS